MNTFFLFLATVIAWFALEFYRVFQSEDSISTQIQDLYRQWPTIGMLAGLITGLLLGHWFFQ